MDHILTCFLSQIFINPFQNLKYNKINRSNYNMHIVNLLELTLQT